jgi:hypothetical protein
MGAACPAVQAESKIIKKRNKILFFITMYIQPE